MESAPPSYETATLDDAWQLVASYLTSDQLCQASLVSRKWHDTFTPHLWGKPTSHFGLEYNGVLDHLARFQKSLELARIHVRSYTYCLHLTTSEAVYFDDRPSDWLKRLLQLLPNLQALDVPGVSFFDHAACQALSSSSSDATIYPKSDTRSGSSSTDVPRQRILQHIFSGKTYHGLRLLNASRCYNLTSSSLASALNSFSSLLYLDLSYTRAARGAPVFEEIRHLYTLKILKLRAVQLKDSDLPALSAAIGRRVCCLDIRDNTITSSAIDSLVDSCFANANELNEDFQLLADIQLARMIHSAYTSQSVNRLTIEDVQEEGLAQLSISGNQLDEIALSKLLHQPCLRVLDIGTLAGPTRSVFVAKADMARRLTYLRVHCSLLLSGEDKQTSTYGLRLRLQPALLLRLHTLVLTNVPTFSRTDRTAGSIIEFIKACASEAYKAMSVARADYTAPPGRHDQASTLRSAASKIFSLQILVLEMSALVEVQPSSQTTSLTQDNDSEAMWSAGESDFSFFRDDNDATTNDRNSGHIDRTGRLVDTLALLSTFRKDRKALYDRKASTDRDVEVEGYWPGTIRIERHRIKTH